MRERGGRFLVVAAGLFLFGATVTTRAGEETDWKKVLEPPPTRGAGGNAFVRWTRANAEIPLLTRDELVLANAPIGERLVDVSRKNADALCSVWTGALASFQLRSGECVEFPRVTGPEGVVLAIDHVRALTRVKRLRARILFWSDDRRADASREFAEMIRIGGAACEGSNSLPSLLASLALLSSGLEGAELFARETDIDPTVREILRDAIRATDGACARGLANALRGEYQLVFRVVVERLPQSHDLAVVLTAVSSLGMNTGESLEETGRLGRVENLLLDVDATLEMRGRPLAALISALEEGKGEAAVKAFDAAEREQAERLRRELGAFAEFAAARDLDAATLVEMPPVLEVLERVKNPVGKLLVAIMPVGAAKISEIVFRHEAQRCDVLSRLESHATVNVAP